MHFSFLDKRKSLKPVQQYGRRLRKLSIWIGIFFLRNCESLFWYFSLFSTSLVILWSLNINPKHITYYCTWSWFMVFDEKIGMGSIFSLSDHQFHTFSTIIFSLLLCVFILVDFFLDHFSLQNCWIYISSLINFSISYIVWCNAFFVGLVRFPCEFLT